MECAQHLGVLFGRSWLLAGHHFEQWILIDEKKSSNNDITIISIFFFLV